MKVLQASSKRACAVIFSLRMNSKQWEKTHKKFQKCINNIEEPQRIGMMEEIKNFFKTTQNFWLKLERKFPYKRSGNLLLKEEEDMALLMVLALAIEAQLMSSKWNTSLTASLSSDKEGAPRKNRVTLSFLSLNLHSLKNQDYLSIKFETIWIIH